MSEIQEATPETVRETTQEIYVLNKRLKLLHSAVGFKTSMDSVLLGAACPVKTGEKILDMGCGVGGAGFSVMSRVDGVDLTGVEIQGEHAALAQQNAVINGFEERAEFMTSDIRDFNREKEFHHVICNPPYLEAGAHLRSPSEEKATAMGHDNAELNLKDWIDAAYLNLKSKGTFTIIYPADKCDKIILGMGKRFGAIDVIPLWPKAGVNAKRVIVRATKDRRSPMTLHAGLTLHESDGEYTQAANKILRDNEALL